MDEKKAKVWKGFRKIIEYKDKVKKDSSSLEAYRIIDLPYLKITLYSDGGLEVRAGLDTPTETVLYNIDEVIEHLKEKAEKVRNLSGIDKERKELMTILSKYTPIELKEDINTEVKELPELTEDQYDNFNILLEYILETISSNVVGYSMKFPSYIEWSLQGKSTESSVVTTSYDVTEGSGFMVIRINNIVVLKYKHYIYQGGENWVAAYKAEFTKEYLEALKEAIDKIKEDLKEKYSLEEADFRTFTEKLDEFYNDMTRVVEISQAL